MVEAETVWANRWDGCAKLGEMRNGINVYAAQAGLASKPKAKAGAETVHREAWPCRANRRAMMAGNVGDTERLIRTLWCRRSFPKQNTPREVDSWVCQATLGANFWLDG